MTIYEITAVITGFFLLLTLIVWIKNKTKNAFSISNTDIVLALLPIVIYLLLSDKIKSLQVGDLKLETALRVAQNKNIQRQISDIQVRPLPSFAKGNINELDAKLDAKPEALKFKTGSLDYAPDIVRQYLTRLSSSTVKFIVFETLNGDFLAMITLYDLNNQLLDPTHSSFEKIELKSLRRILTLENAVSKDNSKKDALKKMQEANSTFLPVVDNSQRLLGIIEDSKLISSLLLDVSSNINE